MNTDQSHAAPKPCAAEEDQSFRGILIRGDVAMIITNPRFCPNSPDEVVVTGITSVLSLVRRLSPVRVRYSPPGHIRTGSSVIAGTIPFPERVAD